MRLNFQSKQLYRLLLQSNKPLPTQEAAYKLKIAPNNLYRLADPLIEMGLVKQIGKYPTLFSAQPMEKALGLFLLNQTQWLKNEFGSFDQSQNKKQGKQLSLTNNDMQFSFIQSRDELMNVSETEIDQTNKSINLLRSGHEIPPEVILAMTKAIKRGVIIRMIIQNYDKENATQIANWQKNGILVKHTNLKHLRLMLYDTKTVYFMSYKHTDSVKDMGMKITYPPLAVLLLQFFEQLWRDAEEIKKPA